MGAEEREDVGGGDATREEVNVGGDGGGEVGGKEAGVVADSEEGAKGGEEEA